MDVEEFRRNGKDMVDYMCQYLEGKCPIFFIFADFLFFSNFGEFF
jgi:hypothetical protein